MQAEYEDKSKDKNDRRRRKNKKAQDKNDDGNFLRDNDEQPDKEDEAMRGTQTQSVTPIAKKREDHSNKQQLTVGQKQEPAYHEPDTLARSIEK